MTIVLCALGALVASEAAACANEAFRLTPEAAALPDCRAFEQATPIGKNGGDATATLPWAKAAAQGGGISFISKSGIPGGSGAQEFPGYEASRGEGAWATHGLLPPASEGQEGLVLGWTPDFSEVFTEATRLGSPSETELLARPGTGGAPTKVVDYTSGLEAVFAATTEDGSLLFESPVKLAEGAVPGKPNVYLWDRESGQVSLAGVLNSGKAPAQGAIAGPYDWMLGTNPATLSQGGGKRNYYTQDEHAISADGRVAYFTAAGTGKLYARLNPTAPQGNVSVNAAGEEECEAGKACTIEISASRKTNGNGTSGTELGGPRPAAFQGASEDGTAAYFTSPEELRNESNTGPEPSKPPPAAFISRAKIGPLEGEGIEHGCIEGRGSGLATDGTYVYWAEREAGAIGRAKLDCTGTPEPAFITGLPEIEDLAVDEGHIYWTEPTEGAIGRADIEGHPGSVETQFIVGAERPKGIAVGCGHLYWTEPGDEVIGKTHFLGRATLGAGEAKEVDQEFIKFKLLGQEVPAQGVAVDCANGHIYVAMNGAYIFRFELDGTKDPQELNVSSLARDVDLALGGEYVYFTQEETAPGDETTPGRESLISRVKLDLSKVEENYIKAGKEHVQSVAVEGEHIYWANNPPASTKPGTDLYRYDFAAPEGERLTDLSAEAGANGAEARGVLGTSRDGSVVYFAANGVLAANEGPLGSHAEAGSCKGELGLNSPASGKCNLYRWEAGESEPTFVARLDTGGDKVHSDAADWAATSGITTSQFFLKTARVSADGDTLLFRSQEKLTEYENTPPDGACETEPAAKLGDPPIPLPCPELYRFNTEEGLACVSCDPSGAPPAGEPDLGNVSPATNTIPAAPASFESRNLSAAGGRVFFETPDALVPADTNGEGGCPLVSELPKKPRCQDVYEWEAAGEGSCTAGEATAQGGCVHLLSSGKAMDPALFADASEEGEDVFFFSRDRLVGQDEDELMDVYDARELGGLASQFPPKPPPPCESAEACHGPEQAPESEESPASAAFEGGGNVEEPQRHHAKRHRHHHGRHGHHPRGRGGARIARITGPRAAEAETAAAAAQPATPAAGEAGAATPPTAPRGAGAAATGTPQVAWKLRLEAHPTNFVAGESAHFLMVAAEVGAKHAAGPIVLTDTLPPGLTPLSAEALEDDPGAPIACKIEGQTVTCESAGPIHAGFSLSAEIRTHVGALPEPSTIEDEAEISGGGASATASLTSQVSSESAPFAIRGFDAPALDEEGNAETLAGSHPYALAADLEFPTVEPGESLLTAAGHPRDVTVDLPPGLTGDPAAAPVLCTEAELLIEATAPQTEACPNASQVGIASAAVSLGTFTSATVPLYEMVPPPGSPAVFGFVVVGVFVHVSGSLRSDSDYGISGSVNDLLARSLNPILGAGVELWGNPSDEAHDYVRGHCQISGGTCPVTPQETAFLAMPTSCPGGPLTFRAHADSWEEPSPPFEEREATYQSKDLQGNPVSLEGCGELKFEPEIEAQPTTNVADSPSGLEFDLHQPQETSYEGRTTADAKDVTISFPPGMTVNPSQAAGLEACSEGQIGFEKEAEGRLDFSKAPQSCPDASKLGSLEVTSPLLAQRNALHEVETDPETGEPIPEALKGTLYLAAPFHNPFGSLVAVYLAIEDPKNGIVAKLGGEGKLDPRTGQITTTFTQNPQLPLEDFHAKLFKGSRGAFITPPTCGRHTTEAELTPWSAPEGASVRATDSFPVNAVPGGGPCPSSESQLPNAPALGAGTLQPQAGKYSTLLFKLSRADGTQRIARLEATMPEGLVAKLAGVPYCPQSGIEQARSREAPEQGAAEIADPSCPAASKLGTITAAAGAGPHPYRVAGHAYLAGPYEGAPLSLVAIAPAVAGPFDLGTVVVQTPLYIDPTTARVRAVSDPLPQILDGVPVDLRSVSLHLDRAEFARNPTSCAPKAFAGTATSALGQAAPLSERFEVGGCQSLAYKPHFSVRLFGPAHRGAHPALRAVFTQGPDEANAARISFALPHSEFIDQGHFRTICTRVQFAADQCPEAAIYGHIKATTPLLGYPVEGPIYLRSSSHKLPDAVAVLKGPPSQPIEVDLDGRVDSVNGGIRTTFEVVPDAPVSKAVVTLQGGHKGLFQNSTNICARPFRATLELTAQNGRRKVLRPPLRASCSHHPKRRGKAHHR
jgi:hypothetical protein